LTSTNIKTPTLAQTLSKVLVAETALAFKSYCSRVKEGEREWTTGSKLCTYADSDIA
jgi:hypothetical protein